MLMPRKVKHRKWHGLDKMLRGKAQRGNQVSFGSFGLKSMDAENLTGRQIEAARRAMTRYIARGGKVWIRVFPDKPVTQKGQEVPMGKGKGAVDHYVATIRPGRIIFEIDGVDEGTAREALRRASQKLPVHTRIIKR
ncbi:50S ribosomal protein L16 [Patescibacteria group bacterium]